MAYELEQFCRDCHETLARGGGPGDLEAVRQSLARLLANAAFVERTCGPEAKPGLHLLYEDADLGFQVLAHINEKPRVSPPHTDMTEFRRVDDGADPAHAQLEMTRKYRLNPGEVGVYASSAIHSIDYPEKSRFIRVTGTNLDRIYRDAFDPATGAIKRMGLQQAT
jgi:hypothetical protein